MSEMPGLVKSGEIEAATLVWIEGMDDWAALGDDSAEHGLTDSLHSAVDVSSQAISRCLWFMGTF